MITRHTLERTRQVLRVAVRQRLKSTPASKRSQVGRLEEAAAAYEKAQGHHEEAAAQFREVLRINPGDAAAREALGRVGATPFP